MPWTKGLFLCRQIEVALKHHPCDKTVMCRAPPRIHVEGSTLLIAAHEKAMHGATSPPKDLKGQMRLEAQTSGNYPPNLGATCSLCSIVSLLMHCESSGKLDEASPALLAVMDNPTWENTAALAQVMGWSGSGTTRLKPFHRGQFLFLLHRSYGDAACRSLPGDVREGHGVLCRVNNNRGKPADVAGFMENMASHIEPRGVYASIQTIDVEGVPVGINKRFESFAKKRSVYELKGFIGVTGYHNRRPYLEVNHALTAVSPDSTPAQSQLSQQSQQSQAGDEDAQAASSTPSSTAAIPPPEALSAVSSNNLGHAVADLKVEDDGPTYWTEVDGQDERNGDPPFKDCALAVETSA